MKEVACLPTIADLRRHVHEVLCRRDQLDPGQAPMQQALITRHGRACGLFFQVDGPRLLRNVAPAGNHWLGVELKGKGHADVVGARVVLEAGGRKQTRFAKGGGSYASSGDRRLVFGLGEQAAPGRLTVTWPDGARQHFDGLAGDRYHRIVQGRDRAEP